MTCKYPPCPLCGKPPSVEWGLGFWSVGCFRRHPGHSNLDYPLAVTSQIPEWKANERWKREIKRWDKKK